MAGTMFTYHEGYLRVRFRPTHYGDFLIDLQVSADGVSETAVDDDGDKGEVSTQLSDSLQVTMGTSPTLSRFFGDMVRWLEAMIVGVQECAFRWENEGPEGRLQWVNQWDGRGILHLTWDGSREQPTQIDRRFLLVREQVVRAFYEALRAMTASAEYDRLDHEPVTIGECLGMILDAVDHERFARVLAAMDRSKATLLVDALLAHAYDNQLGHPRITSLGRMMEQSEIAARAEDALDGASASRWLSDAWDQLPAEGRMAEIGSFFGYQAWFAVGERLTDLRSDRIETWLTNRVRGA